MSGEGAGGGPDATASGARPTGADTSVEGSQGPDRWAHRRGEPRTFAAAWILYLFGATVVSVGAVGALGLLSADVYRPAARVMVAVAAAGVCVLWPMVRLSQELPARGLGGVVQDVTVLLGPVQAVVWPQALAWMAGWPWRVVLCLDLFLIGWTLLIGGLLGVYYARPRLSRWAMMALVVLLVLVGPLIAGLSPARGPGGAAPGLIEWLMTSPLTGVYEITRDRSWTGQTAAVDARHWAGVVLAWAGAGVSWTAALWVSGRGRR